MEQKGCYVYCADPAGGGLRIVADDFAKPNGLAFSPDERVLYIADSGLSHDPEGPHHIRAFAVAEGGRLGKGRVFSEVSPGVPDGMRVDVNGNVWTSCQNGVICIAPDGTHLGKVKVPQMVANVCFGGPRRNRLFITATKSLYAVFLGVSGAQVP
jgi:gluconolactonase